MQRVWLLNWNNITYDKDFTAWLLASLQSGIIEWFDVSWSWASAEIQAWKALIECTRTNWEKILIHFENTANVAVDMSGTKKVYIAIDQAKIDDWANNNEDGTGIWEIKTGASYPAGNFLALYDVVSGTPADERVGLKSTLKRTGQTPYRLCIIDQDGNEMFLAFWSNGQALISGWPSAIPNWQSPVVDITGLTAKNNPVQDDLMIISDSEDGGINKKINLVDIFSVFNDISDWDLNITSNTSLSLDNYWNNWLLIKNYKNITISNGILSFSGTYNNWSIVVLKCDTFTMSGGTITMVWKWASWWNNVDWLKNLELLWPITSAVRWQNGTTISTFGGAGWIFQTNDFLLRLSNSPIWWWSGGWAWGAWSSSNWWNGGAGWGGLFIIANKINITGGTINVSWDVWVNWNTQSGTLWCGGWGWGWGWFLFIKTKKIISNTGTKICNWWNGGAGWPPNTTTWSWFHYGWSWWGWGAWLVTWWNGGKWKYNTNWENGSDGTSYWWFSWGTWGAWSSFAWIRSGWGWGWGWGGAWFYMITIWL